VSSAFVGRLEKANATLRSELEELRAQLKGTEAALSGPQAALDGLTTSRPENKPASETLPAENWGSFGAAGMLAFIVGVGAGRLDFALTDIAIIWGMMLWGGVQILRWYLQSKTDDKIDNISGANR
jgi:hypothetical protein